MLQLIIFVYIGIFQYCFRFSLLEQAPKMLFLNTAIRGYPKGLRAGSDPRKPIVSIDEGFEKFEYRGIVYPLEAMEVVIIAICIIYVFYPKYKKMIKKHYRYGDVETKQVEKLN